MPKHENPFDDILQPQPQTFRSPTFEDDLFGDDEFSAVSGQSSHSYGRGTNVSNGNALPVHGQLASSSKDQGQFNGVSLDPFFDESVQSNHVKPGTS